MSRLFIHIPLLRFALAALLVASSTVAPVGWAVAWANDGASLAAPAVPDAAAPPLPAPLPAPAPSTLPHDLSAWGMFMQADWVVKAVMIGLVLMSVMTWTVWLAKTLELRAATRAIAIARAALGRAGSLAEAAAAVPPSGPAGALVKAAVREVEMSADVPGPGIKERVASRLERIEAATGRRLTKGTGILASVGSTAPFIGLFGTVWGIMNAFIGISKAQTTNLAVVAPGIAEALLATALGLVAAIPAVMIYNAFVRSIGGVKAQLGDASAEIQRLVSRDLDRRTQPALTRAAE